MNVFDPSKHLIVAVDAKGQHLHVTLQEIASDLSALPGPVASADPRVTELAHIVEGLIAKVAELERTQRFILENALGRVELTKGP